MTVRWQPRTQSVTPLSHRPYALSNAGLWTFLILLIGFFALTTQGFFTSNNALNVIRQMSILAIAAFGSSYIIFSGGLDLSIGSNAALAGVVAALVARDTQAVLPVEASWVIGIVVGGIVGLINGLIIVQFKISPIITTLGSLTIARGLALLLTGGVSLFGVPTDFQGLGRGFVIPGLLANPVAIMLILLIVGWLVLKRTTFGMYVYAIGGNEEAARLSGVPVKRVKTMVYLIGGATAGLAGVVLASRLGSGQAAGSQGLELDVITAIVLGGASIAGGSGGIIGTFAGVLILSILENGMTLANIDPFWQQIVKGLALLIAVGLEELRKRRRPRVPTSLPSGGVPS
jgi:ribose transport system permease protein